MNIEEKTLSVFMKSATKYPILDRKEELKVARKAKRGDKKSREKLIVSNLRFVVQQANTFKRYTRNGKISLMDIIQEGNAGLIYAYDKYDVKSGYRFITYAVHWIRARIMTYILRTFSIVRIGTSSIERKTFYKQGQIRNIIEEQNQETKTNARNELAKQLKVTEDVIKKMEARFVWRDISTEKTMGSEFEEGGMTIGDMLVAPSAEQEYESRQYKEKIHDLLEEAMQDLSEREKDIMTQRWLSDNNVTLQELGDANKISRERVRQIEASVFEKIRTYLQNDELGREIIETLKG